jgi:hypothetical protein
VKAAIPENGPTSPCKGIVGNVESIDLSKLRAAFVKRLERARDTGQPPRAMRGGVPTAKIPTSSVLEASPSGFGVMAGTVRGIGDTVVPLEESDWEALR